MDHLKDAMMAEVKVAMTEIPKEPRRDFLMDHLKDITMA